MIHIMTLCIWRELVPDSYSWIAVEHGPEHKERVKNGTGDHSRPCAVPHESVHATVRREKTEVLQQDGHLDDEAERAVYNLANICPLAKLVSAHMGKRLHT